MQDINISESDLEQAKNRYSFNNLKNSISKGTRQIYGALGEIIILKYYKNKFSEKQYKTTIVDESTYDYDLIINNKTVEVKTKMIKFTPQKDYVVSVACSNDKQNYDYIFFTIVHENMTKGWLLGFMPKKDFEDKRIFCKKGELCPVNPKNGYRVAQDCWSLSINNITYPIYPTGLHFK